MAEPIRARAKILIVHAQASADDCGGSYHMLSRFLEGLDPEQFDTHVVLSLLDRQPAPEDSAPMRLFREKGFRTHLLYVPVNQISAGVFGMLRYGIELLAATWRLWRLIRRERIELVYSNSLNLLASGFAARLAGVRSVYHIHEIVRKPKPVARLLARLVGALADRLICVSKAAQAPFKEVGVAEHKLVHVANCIDLSRFDAGKADGAAVRAEFLRNSADRLVVSVGRVVPKKGHEVLVAAAQQVVQRFPGVRFLIVGDRKRGHDPYAEGLERQIRDLGLQEQVRLTGPRSDVAELMAAADVAVLATSSQATPESFGLVVLEALAMGTPVVASNLGGIPEILPDGRFGKLFPPGDAKALAEALLALLQDPEKAKALGKEGQTWVRANFGCRGYARKVSGVLREESIQ